MRPRRINLSRCLCRAALAGFCFFSLVAHAEKVQQLKAQGFVNDFAGVLDAQSAEQISNICAEVDQKTQAQIAVVTVKTLDGLEASDFGNQLFKQWGIGHKADNRGVLILLAASDHKYWTEVGYGLEPILPDGKVGGFGREMVPSLRAGDYNSAVLHLTAQIADTIAKDRGVKLDSLGNVALPQSSENPSGETHSGFFPGGIFLLLFIFFALNGIFRLFRGGHLGGGGRRGGGYWGGGYWGGGGFSGGSSGGGGSFGGFGGGMSGGGGAGGGW